MANSGMFKSLTSDVTTALAKDMAQLKETNAAQKEVNAVQASDIAALKEVNAAQTSDIATLKELIAGMKEDMAAMKALIASTA